MASLYLPTCNILFLHVPKTAGYSITTAIKEAFDDVEPCPTRGMERLHGAARHVGGRLGHDIFANAFSFCFLRNPWDWAVSGWLYVTEISNAYGETPPNFEDFVTGDWKAGLKTNPHPAKFASPELYVAYHTQVTQAAHLEGLQGTVVPIAFYARFERLAIDWARICERMGRDIELPHMNRAERKPYTEYYTDELRNIVAERNRGFIERFGYRFGE